MDIKEAIEIVNKKFKPGKQKEINFYTTKTVGKGWDTRTNTWCAIFYPAGFKVPEGIDEYNDDYPEHGLVYRKKYSKTPYIDGTYTPAELAAFGMWCAYYNGPALTPAKKVAAKKGVPRGKR